MKNIMGRTCKENGKSKHQKHQQQANLGLILLLSSHRARVFVLVPHVRGS
jgi:hypothetical protein